MQKISNPIIIHGPGRSGTTLLSNTLSLHPELYWVSGWVNKWPEYPILGFFNRLQYIPILEKMTRSKQSFPRPAEAYNFWNHFFPEFGNGKVEVVSELSVKECLSTLDAIRKYAGRERFVTKITGLPRTNVIDALFENPVIVWIDRSPEDVVMSYYKQRWKYKTKPEIFETKEFEELIDEYVALYSRFQQGKVELISKFKVIDLKYEDMITDRKAFFELLLQSLNLKITNRFINIACNWNLLSATNTSYKDSLSIAQLEYLTNVVKSIKSRQIANK